jgi:signal transduction histidine kinase
VQPMFVEMSLVAVMFGTARWGRPLTVVAGGLSIPLIVAAGVLTLVGQGYDTFTVSPLGQLISDLYYASSTGGVATALAAVATVLAAPWLAGLTVRFAFRARDSRASQARAEQQTLLAVAQTEQAREIARLREEQARLARDVHDVVGHSLAVILAQAESAQFLPDDDPARLKQTMATIASSARSSLQDVRQVLSAPDGPTQTRPLDTLVDGVRASGHDVVLRELGTARPLPPELEVTAYRVLQEMLTNAVKHGRRAEPVLVERHWPEDSLSDELRIEVRNGVDEDAPPGERGSGLDGMRKRLEAVGGRLDVRRREEDDATTTFTVTAWIPLGPR